MTVPAISPALSNLRVLDLTRVRAADRFRNRAKLMPEAGEHAEEVLRRLNSSDADIQRLRDAKIV